VLAVLAVAYTILAINIVPHYTLLALGSVRFVSVVNIAGGILSLVAAALLIPSFGLLGAAAGRLFYGPAVALNFLKIKADFTRIALPREQPVALST
jgi:O-antigen/teichoic acid export membrane protein